jgi:PelA/Pel-15E family pectate lyase
MRFLYSLIAFILVFCSCMAQKTEPSVNNIWDNMLVYQLPNGGWSKQYADGSAVDYKKVVSNEVLKNIHKEDRFATIDNRATTQEIEALAEGFQKTSKREYKEAVIRGINYLLSAQYENGGFPQYYPDTRGYRSQITFNDNAMINVLELLRDVAKGEDIYDFIDEAQSQKASIAVQKGVDCILKAQVRVGDDLTVWAAQYDEQLQPAQARKFEPISLAASESVGVVRFLMKEEATEKVVEAIESAIKWFNQVKIEGYRFDSSRDSKGKMVRKLVPAENAVLWSRFYEIGTNRPVFGDRDDAIYYNFDEISEERKNGYSWYGEWPVNLLKNNYPKWLKSINSKK